jgi:DNA polymerase I-like protein with 3'-5' exonuclease and polymerase domains
MILEVKDEHVAKVKRLVEEKAQSPYSKLKVPLTADLKVGKSWAEVA